MSDQYTTPHDTLAAFLTAYERARSTDGGGSAVHAAHKLGESTATADMTIEETFELLEQEASETLHELSADLLGSIVRGYVDQVVRMRGHTRRRGTGRLSSHVSRLAALHRINRAATASLLLDDMLSTVVGVVAETIGGDACSVFLYDDHSRTLMLRATVGLNPETVGRLAIRADAGIAGLTAQTRQTQVVRDAPAHPAFFTYPIVGEERYTSQVSVPLLLREPDRLVGVMSIQSESLREFDQDEVTFLETAAGELAIAIENARLYSQTDAALRQRFSELQTLQGSMRSLAATLSGEELLQLVVSHALELTNGRMAAVYRWDDERTPALQLAATSDDASCACPLSFVEMVIGTHSAMALSAPDAPESVLLGAPLMTGHGVLGVVCVQVDADENHTEAKLGLFQAFADSAAMALANADLYEDARRGFSTASTLLQEMHHRVRNNLQTVAALLSMQARHTPDPEAKESLQEAVARVQSIAAVHNLLSSDNVTSTTISSVARHVIDEASITVVPPGIAIAMTVEPSEVEVTSRQATILALLINECVTNAIEHGFAGRTRGNVSLATTQDDGWTTVTIRDDGNGLPDGFRVEESGELGLRIARTLAASDLGGSFALEACPDGGARSVIRFPSRH